jgi:hypothetical protein
MDVVIGLRVMPTTAMNKTGICRKISLQNSTIQFSSSGKPTDMLKA